MSQNGTRVGAIDVEVLVLVFLAASPRERGSEDIQRSGILSVFKD